MTWLAAFDGGVRLQLYIQSRASKTEIAGVHGDALKIRLAAPPVDGAANEALVRFLSEQLGVPRSDVILVAGMSGRRKTVMVEGVGEEQVRRRLGAQDG
ncbi:MAG: DUF167 domain-containing protein [Gemmatimonadales bacterium]